MIGCAEIRIEDLLTSRMETYRFLARLYRVEIDEDLYHELELMRFPINTGSKEVDEGHRLLCSYLSRPWSGVAIELAADYVRTFMGHGITMHEAAYPYESVHTSPRRLMMQEARDEVLEIYRRASLKRDADWKDGEDHIAIELEFMGVVAQRAVDALGRDDEGAAADWLLQSQIFLSNHLLNWVPMLVADMLRFAKTDFYMAIAKMTIGFLETDSEFLAEALCQEEAYTA